MENKPTKRDIVAEQNEEALMLPDRYNEAIMGMASRINLGPVVAYDVQKIIEILANEMEPDADDIEQYGDEESAKHFLAREFYEVNIVGAWLGEYTPVFVETEDFQEE